MTEEQIRDLVKECGLDWQRGYMPLFGDDQTNRYAVLIEAAQAESRTRIEQQAAEIERPTTENEQWREKAAVWLASPDAQAKLAGYRELAS